MAALPVPARRLLSLRSRYVCCGREARKCVADDTTGDQWPHRARYQADNGWRLQYRRVCRVHVCLTDHRGEKDADEEQSKEAT